MTTNFNGRQTISDLKNDDAECRMVAQKYAVGTKIIMGAKVGEVVSVESRTVTVRTDGVDRKTPYTVIDEYEAAGKVTVVSAGGER